MSRLRTFRRIAFLVSFAPITACAQSICPAVDFLAARSADLRPTANAHFDVLRQNDGSYTAFEIASNPPGLVVSTKPHIEAPLIGCLPRTGPPSPAPIRQNSNNSTPQSRSQVTAVIRPGTYLLASIKASGATVQINLFDAQHNLLSERDLQATATAFGQEPFISLALEDVNRDGVLDLVAAFREPYPDPASYGGVWVFRGNGDGSFDAGQKQTLGAGYFFFLASFTVGDIDGDGNPDLVFTGFFGTSLTWVRGHGDGTFDAQAIPLSVGFLAVSTQALPSLAIADLNNDGKPDLVFQFPSMLNLPFSSVVVALGNGANKFTAMPGYFLRDPFGPGLMAIGDVNGDNLLDAVTSGGTVLFGDGQGAFPSRKDYEVPRADRAIISDFDGDGQIDLIFLNGSSDFLYGAPATNLSTTPVFSVLLGAGKGNFLGAPVNTSSLLARPDTQFALADFDKDGYPDMIVISSSLNSIQLSAKPGQGDGQFKSLPNQTFAHDAGFQLIAASAGDFNRDSKPDVAVLMSLSPTSSEVQIYPGHGDGNFSAPMSLPIAQGNANGLWTPDLNGDGVSDLVISTTTGITAMLGKGDGTFSAPTLTVQGNYPGIAFGDFNRDGALDIAIANWQGRNVTILLGAGDGTFPKSVISSVPGSFSNPGGGVPRLTVADLDGNGTLDLAIAPFYPDSLQATYTYPGQPITATLMGQGDATLRYSNWTLGSTDYIAVIDMNGDKVPDLVASSSEAAPIVRLGYGDGTFQGELRTAQPRGSRFFLSDLNKDGKPDVLFTNSDGTFVSYLNISQLQPPLTVISAASFQAGPLAPNSIAAAFGTNIAPRDSLPAPTINVKDSAGVTRSAPIFFSSPLQINFLVPADTAPGPATVTVNRSGSAVPLTAPAEIATVSPALFSVNASPVIAAGYFVQVGPDGNQNLTPTFTMQSTYTFPAFINLRQSASTYLVLFGTGFDAADAASTKVTVQGTSLPVTYAGPQGTVPGLDQINLLLPPSLAGAAQVELSVSVKGKASNTVSIGIQ